MPNALSATVARLGRALYPTDLTDGQLVGRFVAARDGDAFAALVRRHGPMVLAVCRRVAGEHHLAEDAFQAAFLVLARRAADVRPREAVRAWLYGVAVRTAREARAMSARRREVPVAAVPDRPAAAEPRADADELRALDEELARLPDHLRAAVVLCELDGATRKDAAARLGIPEGTLSSRLAKARKLLAARLRGRGVALPAGLAALLGRATDAAVPAALSDAACGLAASTCVPAAVAELSRGVFRIMLLKKLKAVPVLLTLLGVGLGLAWSGGPTSAPAAPAPAARAPDSAIWLYDGSTGRLTAISPAGVKVRELTLPDQRLLQGFSDKGRRLWFAGKDGQLPANPQAVHDGLTLHVRDLSDKGVGTDQNIPLPPDSHPVFSPDGKRVVLHEFESYSKDNKPPVIRSKIVEVATRNVTRLELPTDYQVMSWSPDGKWLLALQYHFPAGKDSPPYRLFKVPVAGGKPELLTGAYSIHPGQFSPDGTKIVCTGDTRAKQSEEWPFDNGVFVIDLATRKMTRIASHPHGFPFAATWSPDGKRIAYALRGLVRSVKDRFAYAPPTRLVVCDADGKNAATIWKAAADEDVNGTGILGWWPTGASDSPKPSAQKSSQAAPKAKGPSRLMVWKSTKFLFVTPDGKEVGSVNGHPDRLILNGPALSPDGRRVAFTVNEDPPTDDDGSPRRHLMIRDADKADAGLKVEINALNVAWSADGKTLLVAEYLPAKEAKDRGFATWAVDPKTGDKSPLDLPKTVQAFEFTPDGRAVIAAVYDREARKAHLARVSHDGKEVVKFTELRTEGPNPRLSPDGRRVLFQDIDPADKPEKEMPRLMRLFVYDISAKTRSRLADVPLNASLIDFHWSPDGKQVAYAWKQVKPGVPLALSIENINDPKIRTETESFLVVADADGANARTILSDKAGSAPSRTIGEFDWRAAKADSPRPSEPRNDGKPAAPKARGLNRLLVANGDKLVLIDPTKQPGAGTEETIGRGWAGRLSPDGRWLALEEQPNEPRPKGEFPLFRPVVRRLDRKGDAIVIPKLGPVAPAPPRVGVWSADSSRLLVEQPLTPARSDGWHEKVSWWLFDPTTGKADRVPVNVPAWHTIEDWSPDGRTFLTMHYVTRPGKPSVIRLALVPRGGGKPELITPDTQSAYAGRFSPDGKRILFVTAEGDEQTGQPFQLFVMDLKDRKPVRVSDPAQGEVALSCSWSPDGKRVAYVRRKLFPSPNPQSGGDPGGNFAVVVADADGKNPKVVMARSVVGKSVTLKGLLVCSWR